MFSHVLATPCETVGSTMVNCGPASFHATKLNHRTHLTIFDVAFTYSFMQTFFVNIVNVFTSFLLGSLG